MGAQKSEVQFPACRQAGAWGRPVIFKNKNMPVKEEGEKYGCNVCGNEVVVTKVGGGTLVCCGEDMELIEEK